MDKLKDWIRRHQVAAFFILVFLITWPGFFLVFFIFPGNQIVEGLMMPVVFGPALAAMLVSGTAESSPKTKRTRAWWITFVVSWVISSMIQILNFWKIIQIDLIAGVIIISCIFALFPAWVLSSVFSRSPGIRTHFTTLLKPKGSWVWYLVIFLIFPGIPFISYGITRLFGGEAYFYLAELGFSGAAVYLVLDFSRGFLMTGGINEESGWRGFALPRLQSRYPVLVSALIVWFFWAAWHLPYDFGRGDELAWILENRLFWNLVISIIMVWLYNRTDGSILAPALFHPAMNTFGNVFSFTPASRVLIIAVAVIAIVSDRMWEKLPDDHGAVVQTPDLEIKPEE